jgi:hypothetical protein
MSKLVRLWVFLAITGLMAACGDSPVGLADNCEDGVVDPNSYCEPGG